MKMNQQKRSSSKFYQLLFLSYFFEYFSEKYCHSSNNHKEDNLSYSWEEYSRNTKYAREKIDNKTNLILRKSQFHKSKVEMVCLISFHRVLSLEYSSSDHIDKIYEVESKDRYSSSNLSSSNDSKCCNKKGKHNGSRISHNHFSGNIRSSKKIGNRNNNGKYTMEKSTIFLTCYRCVSEIELECETAKNNETNKSKATSKPRNSIRKIYSIKNYNIPYNRYNNRYPIDAYGKVLYLKAPEPFIKRNNSSENMAHIGDFYARETDNCSDANLHYESCKGWYFYTTFSDSIQIIDE